MQEQKRQGHDVELMVYDYEQGWVEHFKQQGLVVHHDYLKKPGYDRQLIKRIETYLVDADVVHTHDVNPKMYLAPLFLFNKLKGKKNPRFIHTAHGMDHIHSRPVTQWYERMTSVVVDAVVGVSQPVCDAYIQRLHVPKHKVHLIENGTPLPEGNKFSKAESRRQLVERFKLDPLHLIAVSVARVVPLKDQKLLVEAFHSLPHASLLLVGPSGDELYWQELAQSIPENVVMTGGLSDVDNILAGADVFVSASHHEGIPVSVLEAGAMQLPCLLSTIPGHETLETKSTKTIACFFPVGDKEKFISSFKKLQTDNSLRGEIALNLKELVQTHYSSKAMCDKYMSLYHR
jgi:glycosyltransferase involved in cell wall biosynthesis